MPIKSYFDGTTSEKYDKISNKVLHLPVMEKINSINHKDSKIRKILSIKIATSYIPSGFSGCLEVSFSGGGKLQDQFSTIFFDLVLVV